MFLTFLCCFPGYRPKRRFTIEFSAATAKDLPWSFTPLQKKIEVRIRAVEYHAAHNYHLDRYHSINTRLYHARYAKTF